ncbi:hypothetical protein PAMA_012159 [Pampus argenteus]
MKNKTSAETRLYSINERYVERLYAEKHKMKKQFNRMRQLANQTVGRCCEFITTCAACFAWLSAVTDEAATPRGFCVKLSCTLLAHTQTAGRGADTINEKDTDYGGNVLSWEQNEIIQVSVNGRLVSARLPQAARGLKAKRGDGNRT